MLMAGRGIPSLGIIRYFQFEVRIPMRDLRVRVSMSIEPAPSHCAAVDGGEVVT